VLEVVDLAVEHDRRDERLPVLLVAVLALATADRVEGAQDDVLLVEGGLDVISAKELLGVRARRSAGAPVEDEFAHAHRGAPRVAVVTLLGRAKLVDAVAPARTAPA